VGAPGSRVPSHVAGTDPILYSGKRLLLLGLLAEAETMERKGYYYDAAVSLTAVLEEGEPEEPYYADAEYALAGNLMRAEMFWSAFSALVPIVAAGPSHPHYRETIRMLVLLGRQLPGLDSIREYLAMFEPEDYPADMASEIAFLAASFLLSQDRFEEAEALLKLTKEDDEEWYLKARFLLGALYARLNRARESLDSFKDILRYEARTAASSEIMRQMRSKAVLAIARIFYSTNDFPTALKYYSMLDRLSDDWLQALFETSWTLYRLGMYDQAMGNLLTLTSPYFRTGFFPESYVVEAVILHTRCRYEDAVFTADSMLEEYDGLRSEMENVLARYEDPSDFYYWLAALSKGRGKGLSVRLKRVFNVVVSEPRVHRALAVIPRLDAERSLLERHVSQAPQSELARRLLAELSTAREMAVSQAGEAARQRLEGRRNDLKRYLSQAMRVKFESLTALKAEVDGRSRPRRFMDVSPARPGQANVPEEQVLAWPFEGEYWRDELDLYRFTVDNLCPVPEPHR